MTTKRRKRSFHLIRFFFLFQLVLGFDLVPRRCDRGDGERQVTPSLLYVASSAERLSRRSVIGDRAKPVFSTFANSRTAVIPTADAAADARQDASVRRACVTLGLNDLARIATQPFPASVNKAAGAQQLTRSVQAPMTEILMHSDDRCTADIKSPSLCSRWGPPFP